MSRTNVPAKRAWAQVMVRYSRAVRVNDIIETAATAAIDPYGEVIGKGATSMSSPASRCRRSATRWTNWALRCATWSGPECSSPT